MKPSSRSLLTGILLVAFLGLNSWLPFQATRHSPAHDHHQAATHTSPLCSWLCAAGHISYSEGLQVPSQPTFTVHFEILPAKDWDALVSLPTQSRGPPFPPSLSESDIL